MTVERVVAVLQSNNIMHFVDIRDERAGCNPYEPDYLRLKEELKAKGIVYLPFNKEFGNLDFRVYNSDYSLSYRRAMKLVGVQSGFERLNSGLQKGLSIVVADSYRQSKENKLVNLIGRYYSDLGHEVLHLGFSGVPLNHEKMLNVLADKRQEHYKKKQDAQSLGERGEAFAASYLEQQGYEILAHNWNLHYGCEIDIIARKDNVLHFVEVKTRSTDRYGMPELAITKEKIQHMMKAVRAYCNRYQIRGIECHLDGIGVLFENPESCKITCFAPLYNTYTKFYN